ncbi:Uncharacterised protein [uncultured archaeon]|nr:Uncharacterised protein [uncultured archaeon]
MVEAWYVRARKQYYGPKVPTLTFEKPVVMFRTIAYLPNETIEKPHVRIEHKPSRTEFIYHPEGFHSNKEEFISAVNGKSITREELESKKLGFLVELAEKAAKIMTTELEKEKELMKEQAIKKKSKKYLA